MNQNPMIPPNFVTLRQLKEKREQEEKLKKEKEEKERLLRLEEEEKWLRKLKDEEEASKTLRNHHPRMWREVDPRRSANLDAHVAANGRSDLEGSKKEKGSSRREKEKRPSRWKKEKKMTGMTLSLDGSEKAEAIGSDSGPVLDIEKQVSAMKMGGRNPNWKGRRRGSRNWGRGGGDSMTELPLSINGFGAPMNENEEVATKVIVEVIGSQSGAIAEIEKRVSNLKLGGRNPNLNRKGRGAGNWGRGGDGGDGMVWVEKTTKY